MSRRHVVFTCQDSRLVGSLDEPEDQRDATAGLLIVSGGNEIRSGAFAGQAAIAQAVAAAGFPVLRFDRRGVGDSEGENAGFRGADADIGSALAAFRRECPALRRIVGFGNCDAASALMLRGGRGFDALVLANPWTFADEDEGDPDPHSVRARYAARLRNPREIGRLLTGGVSLRKLARGVRIALSRAPAEAGLAADIRRGLEAFGGESAILLSGRDRTGNAFAATWPADDPRIANRSGADHAFSDPADREWLTARLLSILHEQARQLDMG